MQNDVNNYLDINNLRLEIAILQENIDSQNPGIHKFTIPSIITGEKVGTIYIQTKNSANRKLLKSTIAKTTFDPTIELRVPKEYTAFFGADIIPKGTRFIVAFIGGNVNNIRIIGRYDSLEDMEDR